ncbi:MAG: Nif3-like dinuclear metal center hexameric protein [Bacteroidota bacterium]|jgi:dinuclear metal center YbgI/SA1388 family protein
MILQDIISELEQFAPISYQENYDNSGLLIGDVKQTITGAILCLDCTEETINEAIKKKCNLIISHHPIIFVGIKKLNGSNYVERIIIKAIQNNIAIYACHTNLDNVKLGVSKKIAEKIGLINTKILAPKKSSLKKLVTFVPNNGLEKLRAALFEEGVGKIGNYEKCSYAIEGIGSFKGNDLSNPAVGKKNELHFEKETRLEVVFESFQEQKILKTLKENHPYEEVAYDIYNLENLHDDVGSGLIGELLVPMPEIDFLNHIKNVFNLKYLKHTALLNRNIKKVSVCGGSGSFLLKNSISLKSDVYISSDFKYHEFFDAESKILIADIGHYESEQFTSEIFYEIISNKFSTFALYFTEINTNPVNYF